jgi:hypothetical protein
MDGIPPPEDAAADADEAPVEAATTTHEDEVEDGFNNLPRP